MRILLLGFCSLLITHTANADDTKWGLSLGGGVALAPHYSGDDDYAVLALPFARVTYDDVFYASIPEGANLKLFDEGGFSVVSTAKFTSDREEDGDAPFQIAGKQTTDLIGLGDVSRTIELGGTVSYSRENWRISAAARQGLGGHDGFVGELSARYNTSIRGYGPPIRISIGPSLNFGDSDYMNAYYGVTTVQSVASGLSQYRASGGLYSVGLSLSATAPVSERSAIFLQGSLSQLMGDAKDAPLVTERGSPTQAFGGIFWVYTFGQDARRGRRRG
ncbi:MipA/OmpV family protein [Fretibacter rubidus]|uniref:MipA/OmpV family protein n=1 Tax=Fretibacter rubidus TaxID=570162 RepID=UPI00352AB859